MNKIEIQKYFELGAIYQLMIAFASKKNNDEVVNKNDKKVILEHLKDMIGLVDAVKMHHSKDQIDHIVFGLKKDDKTWIELRAKLESLQLISSGELENIFVGYIPADHARLWNFEKPFGDAVYNNFPSARADITASGNCYAIEQYNACVFHLMRVVEKGLRALAKERGIKKIKGVHVEWTDWHKIISAIEAQASKIATNSWPRGKKKDKALEFYRGAVGELMAFKDEYRNYTMHDRADYDLHQAIGVYHRVGDFMKRLASKLDENNLKPIKWSAK